jgi:rhamnosyltransferase|tara:strand:- start:2040 stop:3137 length:1098 start_codon:yes stop_codon:yes gene_type:complete
LKSTTGRYYLGLDHIRALAAFMVFSWHFIDIHQGQLEPPPIIPLLFLTEGHTGVALFMTLSGYLFAKLLDGKEIRYIHFIWNRALRLLPLLIVVILMVGVRDYFEKSLDLAAYAVEILKGPIYPTLPNGGWSITVEFHFYLILPLLLFCSSRLKYSFIFFIGAAIVTRYLLFLYFESPREIQFLSYGTIVGRLDQFVLGIAAFQYRELFKGRHLLALAIFAGFTGFFFYIDSLGGFYNNTSLPSVWIYMTTVEGFAYASLIAWYDTSFRHAPSRVSRSIALVGTYSYSIYLLHFFFFTFLAVSIERYIVDLSNIYVALLFSAVAFLVMIPIGYLSYRFIESPFLKFRTSYIRQSKPSEELVSQEK